MYNLDKMETIDVKVKKWGNSLGVVLPRNILDSENIAEGSDIEISVRAKHKTKVKDIFGMLKGKLVRDTDEVLKEIDEEFEPHDW